MKKGQAIYNYRCYFCHGYSGDAKTLAASFLDPKPRNFLATDIDALSRREMINVVHDGKAGTAMKSFAQTLTDDEIEAVVDFVRQNFMRKKAANSAYHTPENGWPDMQPYAEAFGFARGEIALDTPESQLSAGQRRGKFVFMNSCVSCHDRANSQQSDALFEPYAVSYPRNAYSPQQTEVDTVSRGTPYAKHEQKPKLTHLSDDEKAGETLFQNNCAFCHAADGSGKNWIGSFLQPHPRNLSNHSFMATMSRARLKSVIENGIPGSTMSSWKSVLSDQQIEQIIAYIIRVFGPLAADNGAPAPIKNADSKLQMKAKKVVQ